MASYFLPYPVFMENGEGHHIYDCDGNEYIDVQYNYTSLVHGHANPKVTETAKAQMEKGLVLGSAGEIQYRHAQHLCNRIPSVEMVRYANSGTEATMFALRLARAFTGREGIMKLDGGYHGGHDYAQVNIFPEPKAQGLPSPWAESWIPRNLLKDVVIAPFNDLETTEMLLRKHKDSIAALIMEPMFSAGGLIFPEPEYIKGMREITDRNNVLLVFDEVMMFRLHYGGLQTHFGIKPDLTALGKIIGGGFPVGAICGRKDIMELSNPNHPHPVFHSGTFSGNNITLATGLATLELYDEDAVTRLNSLGDRLQDGFRNALQKHRIRGHVTGYGSLLGVHWRKDEPKTARDTFEGFTASGDFQKLFHLEMLNRSVFSSPRSMYVLATPMTDQVVDKVVEAFEGTLELLKPLAADEFPDLLIT
jgi:glutamate-1-semialdehyde 2,1-aminomutase